MLIQYGDVNVQTTVNGLQQTDLIFMLFHLWMCNTVIGGSNILVIKYWQAWVLVFSSLNLCYIMLEML